MHDECQNEPVKRFLPLRLWKSSASRSLAQLWSLILNLGFKTESTSHMYPEASDPLRLLRQSITHTLQLTTNPAHSLWLLSSPQQIFIKTLTDLKLKNPPPKPHSIKGASFIQILQMNNKNGTLYSQVWRSFTPGVQLSFKFGFRNPNSQN